MTEIIKREIHRFVIGFGSECKDLQSSSFLITGATGLIGSVLVKCLLALDLNIEITIPVRDAKKAIKIFGESNQYLKIEEIQSSLEEWCHNFEKGCQYIVHCASPTNGEYMKEYPVETSLMIVNSTKNLLEYAQSAQSKSMVFVSSIECYGQILKAMDKVAEEVQGYVPLFSPRSSYPMGKRFAEHLCYSSAIEYGVPVKVVRPTQTFGIGVAKDDSRVFAQFARSVINSQDIVLHTTGDSAKPYCDTIDCITAILYVLLKGKDGEVYNVANPSTYISVKEMAFLVRDTFNPSINVRIEEKSTKSYAPITKVPLSVDKLLSLGWRPQCGLKEMFEKLIDCIQDN